MEINELKKLLSDLRKNDTFMKESFDFNTRSNAIKSIGTNFEEKIKKYGFTTTSDIKKSLKEIQSKCEKDNLFAKKSVSISRLDLIEDLMKAHEVCGDKIASFVRSKFSSGEKLIKSLEDTEKTIKKVDNLCDEVFSFKDSFDMYFVTNNLLKFESKFKVDVFFDVVDDCVDSIINDEEEIENFSNLRHDIKIEGDSNLENEKESIAINQRKLNKVLGLLNSYETLTFKIYNKSFELMKHHAELYSK